MLKEKLSCTPQAHRPNGNEKKREEKGNELTSCYQAPFRRVPI